MIIDRFYSRELIKFIEDNSRNGYKFIKKSIQSSSSDICGLYVVFFALMRICFNIPVENIYDMYFTENLFKMMLLLIHILETYNKEY